MLPSNSSVRQWIACVEQRLADKGIENARFESELLVGLSTGWSRLQVLCSFNNIIGDDVAQSLISFCNRRTFREPTAYIRGTQEFFGLEFIVSPDVLIPRPETEILVQLAIDHLQTIADPIILDLGTGSGCIAIAIAHALPQVQVIAVDISEGALSIARKNADMHNMGHRIKYIQGDFAKVMAGRPVDAVVSNPPYIHSATIGHLQPEVRLFEPIIALDGGINEGLNLIEKVVGCASANLKPCGFLGIEFGQGQARGVSKIVQDGKFDNIFIHNDLARVERVITSNRC